MNKLTSIRIKQNDGTYSDDIPVQVLADNVVWTEGSTVSLTDILGQVKYTTKGSIQHQLDTFSLDEVENARVGADDTQYQNLKARLDGEYEDLQDAIAAVAANLQTQTGARSNADTAIRTDLSSQTTFRINGDNLLSGQITSEVAARKAAMNSEVTARNNAISSAIASEVTNRNNAIATETSARQTAISAEASARQTAINNLQAAINSEASTRATTDASLQSQINQIIAPSGEAPSAAEIQNARIGADGVTYSTLGDAIRTNDTALKDAISNEIVNSTKADISAMLCSNRVVMRQNILADALFDNNRVINDTTGIKQITGYSLSSFIPIKTGYYYLYNPTGILSSGGYVALFNESKNILSVSAITGNGGYIQVTNDGYARISISTSMIGTACFIQGVVPVPKPEKYRFLSFFDSVFQSGHACLYDASKPGGIDFAQVNAYNYTNYFALDAGYYYIGKITGGGGYLLLLNDSLLATGQIVLSNGNEFIVHIPEDCYCILTVGTRNDNFKFTKLKDYIQSFSDAKICFYGDSIVAMGNDFNTNSWQGIVAKYFNLNNAISVGIGGTGFVWNDNYFYDLSGHTLGESLPLNATHSSGSGERVSLCAWNRIEETVPTDCDIIFVMGGTNDIDAQSGDRSIISNSPDTAWVESTEYAGGDYNVRSLIGGILSTIMKLRARAPKAKIVMCSPIGGRGNSNTVSNQIEQYVGSNGLETFNIAEEVQNQSKYLSTDFIDVYRLSGITTMNRTIYISDRVHPNNKGMEKIAKCFIQEIESHICVFPDSDTLAYKYG